VIAVDPSEMGEHGFTNDPFDEQWEDEARWEEEDQNPQSQEEDAD